MIPSPFTFVTKRLDSSKTNRSELSSYSNKTTVKAANQSMTIVTEPPMLSFSSHGFASTERVPPAKVYSDPIPVSLKRKNSKHVVNSMPLGTRSYASFSSPIRATTPHSASFSGEQKSSSLFAFGNYMSESDESDDSSIDEQNNEEHSEMKDKKHNMKINTDERRHFNVHCKADKLTNAANTTIDTTIDTTIASSKNKIERNNKNKSEKEQINSKMSSGEKKNSFVNNDTYSQSESDEYDDFAANGTAITSPIFHIRSKNMSLGNRNNWQHVSKSASQDLIKSTSTKTLPHHKNEECQIRNCKAKSDDVDTTALEKSNTTLANGRIALSSTSSPVFPVNCWHLPWSQHKVQMCQYCHRPIPPERINNTIALSAPTSFIKETASLTMSLHHTHSEENVGEQVDLLQLHNDTNNGNQKSSSEQQTGTIPAVMCKETPLDHDGDNNNLITIIHEDEHVNNISDNYDVNECESDWSDNDDDDDDEMYNSGVFGGENSGYCHCKFGLVNSFNQLSASRSKVIDNNEINNINASDNNKKVHRSKSRPLSRPPSPVLYVVETRHSHSKRLAGTIDIESSSSSSSSLSSASSLESSPSFVKQISKSKPIVISSTKITQEQESSEKARTKELTSEQLQTIPHPNEQTPSSSSSPEVLESSLKTTLEESSSFRSASRKSGSKVKGHHPSVRLSLVQPLTTSSLHSKTRNAESNKTNKSTPDRVFNVGVQKITSELTSPLASEEQEDGVAVVKNVNNGRQNNYIDVNNNIINSDNNKKKVSTQPSTLSKKGNLLSSWVKDQRNRLSPFCESKSPNDKSKQLLKSK